MELVSKNIKYYSSDFNNHSLIYSDKEGNIVFNNEKIVLDHFKKTIKFYPPDDKVFTTTDVSGLRVWDAYKGNVLYSYKNEELTTHSYSQQCILSAAGQYNINFYDLRSRYVVHSIPHGQVIHLEWAGECLYLYNGSKITVYDYKQQEEIASINDCLGFSTAGEYVFILKKENDQNHICIFNSKNNFSYSGGFSPNQPDIINKTTRYNKIMSIKDQNYIIGYYDQNIILESFDRVVKLDITEKIENFDSLYINGDENIIFMNDNLYRHI